MFQRRSPVENTLEKPFGRASYPRVSSTLLHRRFAESAIFRIDHYPGKLID
jgi:glucose-6-phosphate 1-dehydrogenase